jgi:hypothetical protein
MLHGYTLRVSATKLLRRQFLHLAAGAAALCMSGKNSSDA